MTPEEKAKEQIKSFAESTRKYGDEQLPKITQAGMTILAIIDNRFVAGFSPHETSKLQKGNVLPFMLDIVQWIEASRASKDQLRNWISDTTAFQSHCMDILLDTDMNMELAAEKFSDVLNAYQEIREAKVEIKQPKSERQAGHKQPKKKVSTRVAKRNTVSV